MQVMMLDERAREATFPYHRTVLPMVWALVAIAVAEMLILHFLLVFAWPWLAWPLFLLSCASILWLLRWMHSMKRMPHRLSGGELQLHVGSLRSLTVPVENIAAVLTSWEPGGHQAKGVRNMVVLAHPNRMLRLTRALEERMSVERVAFRVDDPAAFDATMRELGVEVT